MKKNIMKLHSSVIHAPKKKNRAYPQHEQANHMLDLSALVLDTPIVKGLQYQRIYEMHQQRHLSCLRYLHAPCPDSLG